MKSKQSEFIGFRTTKEYRIELEKIGEKEDRTISYIINKAIEKYIEEKKGK